MTVEICQPQTNFVATTTESTREEASIQEDCENRDPESKVFFEECRASGRPYIDFHAPSGTFRYVYFNRSHWPTPELMGQLEALGLRFGLLHSHVLHGEIYAECLDERRSILYQGRFRSLCGGCTPEEARSFADRLFGLLPSFDRPAALDDLVKGSIELGYFTFEDEYSFGDRRLDEEASWVYGSWCREHDHPYITYDYANRCVSYSLARLLSGDAVARTAALAARFGLGRTGGEADNDDFYPLEDGDPQSIPHPDFRGFAGKLREILIDPRSYDPQPA